MKRHLNWFSLVVAVFLSPTISLAADPAVDTASQPVYSSGWTQGTNGGAGWDPWMFDDGFGGWNPGDFAIGSSASGGGPSIDSNGRAFAFTAGRDLLGVGAWETMTAERSMAGPFPFTKPGLFIGQKLSADVKFGSLAGGALSAQLNVYPEQDVSFNTPTGTVTLQAIGSKSTYQILTASGGTLETGISRSSNRAIHLEYTIDTPTSYSLKLNSVPVGGISGGIGGPLSPTPYNPNQIESIDFHNFGGGTTSDQAMYINNLRIGIQQQTVTRTPQTSLITPVSPTNDQLLVYSNGQFLTAEKGGRVNPSLPTVVLTHGLGSDPSTWSSIAQQYSVASVLSNHPVNILAWNWQSAAGSEINPLTWGAATANTLAEGNILGATLAGTLGSSYNKPIQFIGHSLGSLVNGEAATVFENHTHDNANTQVTILDDAEVADPLTLTRGQLPSWLSPIPGASVNQIDNYVSAFGNLRPLSNAVNVILTNVPTGPYPLDWIAFHSYPQDWYAQTIAGPSNPGGFQWSVNNVASSVPFPSGQFYFQSRSNATQFIQTDAAGAAALIVARDTSQLTYSKSTFYLTAALLQGAIQTVGQVTNVLVPEPGNGIDTPQYGLKLALGSNSGASPAFRSPMSEAVETNTTPNPSYAWVTITIPAEAQTLSFNFTYTGLDPSDCLSVGINENQVFSLQAAYIADSTAEGSPLINIAQYAGQQVELFFGYSGIASGGEVTIQDIGFQAVPEPSGFLSLFISCFAIVLRRSRTI